MEIVSLIPEVELLAHHGAKYIHFFWKGDPLHAWEKIDKAGEACHNAEVARYRFRYIGVENFDGDRGSRDGREGILEDDRT
jgi:hypothetical protein